MLSCYNYHIEGGRFRDFPVDQPMSEVVVCTHTPDNLFLLNISPSPRPLCLSCHFGFVPSACSQQPRDANKTGHRAAERDRDSTV